MKYYDKLIFELSKEGRTGYSFGKAEIPEPAEGSIPANLFRSEAPAPSLHQPLPDELRR